MLAKELDGEPVEGQELHFDAVVLPGERPDGGETCNATRAKPGPVQGSGQSEEVTETGMTAIQTISRARFAQGAEPPRSADSLTRADWQKNGGRKIPSAGAAGQISRCSDARNLPHPTCRSSDYQIIGSSARPPLRSSDHRIIAASLTCNRQTPSDRPLRIVRVE